MTSPLGFKARVGSALFAIFAEANVMYIPQDSPLVLHLPTSWRLARSWSLPHMHVQGWDLAQIRTCNRTNRRRTRYHCASDAALPVSTLKKKVCTRSTNFHFFSSPTIKLHLNLFDLGQAIADPLKDVAPELLFDPSKGMFLSE